MYLWPLKWPWGRAHLRKFSTKHCFPNNQSHETKKLLSIFQKVEMPVIFWSCKHFHKWMPNFFARHMILSACMGEVGGTACNDLRGRWFIMIISTSKLTTWTFDLFLPNVSFPVLINILLQPWPFKLRARPTHVLSLSGMEGGHE